MLRTSKALFAEASSMTHAGSSAGCITSSAAASSTNNLSTKFLETHMRVARTIAVDVPSNMTLRAT